jgi:hypothetical protein
VSKGWCWTIRPDLLPKAGAEPGKPARNWAGAAPRLLLTGRQERVFHKQRRDRHWRDRSLPPRLERIAEPRALDGRHSLCCAACCTAKQRQPGGTAIRRNRLQNGVSSGAVCRKQKQSASQNEAREFRQPTHRHNITFGCGKPRPRKIATVNRMRARPQPETILAMARWIASTYFKVSNFMRRGLERAKKHDSNDATGASGNGARNLNSRLVLPAAHVARGGH